MNDELIKALLSNPNHRDLYLRNATFYNAVNILSRLIPAMIAGIAADAVATQNAVDQRIRYIEGGRDMSDPSNVGTGGFGI